MDVNAILHMIAEGLEDGDDEDTLNAYCLTLFNWLRGGGVTPEWDRYPSAKEYFIRWAVRPGRLGIVKKAIDRWIGEEPS